MQLSSSQGQFTDSTFFNYIAFSPTMVESVSTILRDDPPELAHERLTKVTAMIDHEVGHLNHHDSPYHSLQQMSLGVAAGLLTLTISGQPYQLSYMPRFYGIFYLSQQALKNAWQHYKEFRADDNTQPRNLPGAIDFYKIVEDVYQEQLTGDIWSCESWINCAAQKADHWTRLTPPFDLFHTHPAPQRRIARLQKHLEELNAKAQESINL